MDWFSEDAQPLDRFVSLMLCVTFLYCTGTCTYMYMHNFCFVCRLYELPEPFSFSQYPALAQKFLLKGLKPVPTSDKSWGASVMSALRKLSASNSNELELMANIKDKNVDLYCVFYVSRCTAGYAGVKLEVWWYMCVLCMQCLLQNGFCA